MVNLADEDKRICAHIFRSYHPNQAEIRKIKTLQNIGATVKFETEKKLLKANARRKGQMNVRYTNLGDVAV